MAGAMMDELLGGHRQVVEDLVERLEDLKRGDVRSPRVVVLRGDSGAGKSRIIREVYKRLRDASTEPVYWPSLATGECADRGSHGAGDPMALRKEISPSLEGFLWPANALPSFGWWGFNCERLSTNAGLDVVRAARPQLDAHHLPLLLAWRQAAGVGEKLQAKRDAILREVRDAAVSEGTGGLLTLLGSLNIDVPGSLLTWGWKGIQAGRRHLDERAALRQERDLGESHATQKESAGADLAQVILSVAHRDLPAVVVIEDMHLMGAELAALLTALSEPVTGRPALVIGTAWHEGWHRETHSAFTEWIESAHEDHRAQVVDIEPLDGADLTTMLRWYAPNTSASDAQRVVQRVNSPLFLKMWVTLRRTQRHISRHGGAVVVDGDDAIEVPEDVSQVYKERWKELPPDTRDALLWAVAANPVDDPLAEFVPHVVAGVACDVDQIDPATTMAGLAAAVDPGPWCERGDAVEFFREQALADRARSEADDEFDREYLDLIQRETRRRLGAWINEHRGAGFILDLTPEAIRISKWYLALTNGMDPVEEASDRCLATAGWAVARATELHGESDEMILLGRSALGVAARAAGLFHPDVVNIRLTFGSWLFDYGGENWKEWEAEAVALFAETLAVREQTKGPEDADTLTERDHLAWAYRRAGLPRKAIPLYRQNLDIRERILGPHHPETLASRVRLAGTYADAHMYVEAIPLAERTLADYRRLLSPDHPDTMTAMRTLAEAYRHSRQEVKARALYQEEESWARKYLFSIKLPDLRTTATQDQQSTTEALRPEVVLDESSKRAADYLRAGDIDQAISLYEKILDEWLRLGEDENFLYDFLDYWWELPEARENLASAYEKAGQFEKAWALLEENVAAELDADSGSIDKQPRLSKSYHLAGRHDKAILMWEEILAQHEMNYWRFGSDHPETLDVKAYLATAHQRAENYEKAIELFEQTLHARQRTVGLNHPDTLAARARLADTHRLAGEYEKAVPLYELNLAENKRVPGPDHKDTQQSRTNLIRAYEKANMYEKVTPLLEQDLAYSEKTIGSDHPHTLSLQDRLARTYQAAGAQHKAIPLFEAALVGRQHALGPDSLQTLDTQYFLACSYVRADRFDEGVALIEQTLEDYKRVLGPDEPRTLAVQYALVRAYWESGRHGAAIPLTFQTAEDILRVLGPDHELAEAYSRMIDEIDEVMSKLRQRADSAHHSSREGTEGATSAEDQPST